MGSDGITHTTFRCVAVNPSMARGSGDDMSPVREDLKLVPYTRAMAPINVGDLVLFRALPWSLDPRTWWRSLVNHAIAWMGRTDYCHAGKIVLVHGEYFVAEMVEGCGGRLWPLKRYAQTRGGLLDVFRPDSHGYDGRGAVRQMIEFVGEPYGWGAIASAFALHLPFVRHLARTAPTLREQEGHPYCSAAVAMADEEGGGVDPVPELATRHTEPGDLARSHLYGRNYVLTIAADPPPKKPMSPTAAARSAVKTSWNN